MLKDTKWTQSAAITLCKQIESIAPLYGCHVALTGGCLYKPGPRKDADILFYRIRQEDDINIEGLFKALAHLGLKDIHGRGWCFKATYATMPVDMFFPEEVGGDYGN